MNTNPNNNQGNSHSGDYGKSWKIQSPEKLADNVKKKFFPDETLYNDLFALESSIQLDKVFDQLKLMVQQYADSVTTSQLRNVYAEIVKAETSNDLKLIRPHVAYITARQEKDKAKEFMAFIDLLIQKVNTNNELHSFKKTMEAIVAYHRFYAKN